MVSSLRILTSLSLIYLASGKPSVYFPFNSQLPPVARIAEVFSYTLSPQTFSSGSNLTYSLNDAPEWLSIDNQTGHLYGTPQEDHVPDGEVVGIPVDIVATDDSGSETMTATLVVSRNRAPQVAIPLSEQIQNFGDQAAPDALVSYPSSRFSFSFADDTFSPRDLNYYATSADSSPLPSWIRFDADTLTFSGTTPPFENLIQPPQTFSFHLVASDVVGFSASHVLFSIVVGSRKLTIGDPVVHVNATRGRSLSYRGLGDDIELDGETVDPADLTVSTENMPEWLSVDNSTLEIKGTPPRSARSINSTITLRNALSDALEIQLVVTIATEIFRKTVSDLEVTATEAFSLDLEPYLWRPDDVSLDVASRPSQDWLKLDGLVISGTPPEASSQADDSILLTIRATEESSGEMETETVRLNVLSPADLSSTTSTSARTIATSTASATPSESADVEREFSIGPGLSGEQIMLAVLVPILVIALLVLLLLFLRRRRERKFRKIQARDISRPLPENFIENGSSYNEPRPAKKCGAVPPPETAYRPGQKGYWLAAWRRLRSARSISSVDSDSHLSSPRNSPPPSILQEPPPTLPKIPSVGYHTLPGARNSWVTEEERAGVTDQDRLSQPHRRSRYSILSLYESMRDLPRPSFSRNHAESTSRGKLDVTIPSVDDLGMGLQPAAGAAQVLHDERKQPGESSKTKDVVDTTPSPAASLDDALSSIPERSSPLGSHPPTTYARKLPHSRPGRFRVYSDSDALSQPSFETMSGYSDSRGDPKSLSRQDSQWSDASHRRPVSRRSDASPWFGGRSVIPARHPRRYQFSADTSSSLMSRGSISTGSGPRNDEKENGNENWQTIPPRAVVRGTENWHTIPSDYQGLGYSELVRESPFYSGNRSSRTPRRGRSSGMTSAAGDGTWEKKRYHTWMGKGVSLRQDGRPRGDGSWGSESSASLMSPSKWETAQRREPLAERPISSIRQVPPSGMFMAGHSSRPSRASKVESVVSEWVTEIWSSLDGDGNGSQGERLSRDRSREAENRGGGLSRDNGEGDYAVFI